MWQENVVGKEEGNVGRKITGNGFPKVVVRNDEK
jgi:hypothetical protein